jgi:hypothetical protein
MDTRAIVGLIIMVLGAAVIIVISLKDMGSAFLLAIGYLFVMSGFLEDLMKFSDKKGESIDKK